MPPLTKRNLSSIDTLILVMWPVPSPVLPSAAILDLGLGSGFGLGSEFGLGPDLGFVLGFGSGFVLGLGSPAFQYSDLAPFVWGQERISETVHVAVLIPTKKIFL